MLPIYPDIRHSYKTMNASRHKNKTPHILVKLSSIHIIGQFKESQQVLHKTLNMFDNTGSHRRMDTNIHLESSKL